MRGYKRWGMGAANVFVLFGLMAILIPNHADVAFGKWEFGKKPKEIKSQGRTLIQVLTRNSECGTGSCRIDPVYTVPAGKRLIIEYINVRSTAGADTDTSARVAFSMKFGSDSFQTHNVGVTKKNGPGPNSSDVLGEVVKLYADPESIIICEVTYPGGENISGISCGITGFLEDAPEE